MADPRKIVRFDGIGEESISLYAEGTTLKFERDEPFGTSYVGAPVKISDEGEVSLAGDGEDFFGALKRIEADNLCSVTWRGVARFKGTATDIEGQGVIGAGSGAVKVADPIEADDGDGGTVEIPAGRGQLIGTDGEDFLLVLL